MYEKETHVGMDMKRQHW